MLQNLATGVSLCGDVVKFGDSTRIIRGALNPCLSAANLDKSDSRYSRSSRLAGRAPRRPRCSPLFMRWVLELRARGRLGLAAGWAMVALTRLRIRRGGAPCSTQDRRCARPRQDCYRVPVKSASTETRVSRSAD
jgi:hypothetical protein